MATAEGRVGANVPIGTLVGLAAARLLDAGSPTPRLDAELLVAHAASRDRAWLHAHPEATLDAGAADALVRCLERRAAGEPIAYIRGFKDWRGLRVGTDRRALIPRPETELLADAAIAEIVHRLGAGEERITCWELGTGSGAVALALALRFRSALQLGRLRLVASDASPDAVELASENLAAHGVVDLVTLACGDLLDGAGGRLPTPDLVVANLPYLRSDEVARGEGSLRYEPRAALDGGRDGLDLVRRLVAELPERMAAHGVALLEVGARQADEVARLAAGLPAGFTTRAFRDLAGHERVIAIRARPAQR